MIYPKTKKKKVLKAESGVNTKAIEDGVIAGVNAIPVYGQAISAAMSIGSSLGKSITGDGTNAGKNLIGDTINPFSTLGAIAGGHAKEAIPIVGSFLKARRLKKEKSIEEQRKESVEAQKARIESNKVFGAVTMDEGGVIGEDDNSVVDGVQDFAVVLGGNSHKDGGNDVIDTDTGEKVAETESEELLFTATQTKSIESQIEKYESAKNKESLVQLGVLVKDIVLNEMKDNSGKY